MARLLIIDTALSRASAILATDGKVLQQAINEDPKQHGAFLQPAIGQILNETGTTLETLDAIAVIGGPGSYTGLRVGLASAKGLCYALDKPLILLNTLSVMALAAREWWQSRQEDTGREVCFCPMIDARRMEVFTAVYDSALQEIISPGALVLTPESFAAFTDKVLVFSGNGSAKVPDLIPSDKNLFYYENYETRHMAALAETGFQNKIFASVAYAEPLYTKEFYDNRQK
jgi:tRNA threonylcarbamoyladenosine biosynthesis protein TsaB